MELTVYQVDAFSSEVFAGNPAAVCPLEAWLPDDLMQDIARENNLSETAFFVREGDGFRIRWFTPEVEVDLCGHATLASGHVIFKELGLDVEVVRFESRSGTLQVTLDADRIVLDFPARPGEPRTAPDGLLAALGKKPIAVLRGPYWMFVYADEAAVRSLAPNFEALTEFDPVIATAPGSQADFVSRFFAPSVGVNEDPVTGSAHCTLVPYWSERLGKSSLRARQISHRGGELQCEDRGDRVSIAGHCALYLRGTIYV